MKVGFIGLGRMGAPMAKHLATAHFTLSLFDRRAEAAASLAAELSARALTDPAQVAKESTVVVLSLPGYEQVAGVMTGPGGILDGAAPGLIVVDTTTVSIAQSRDLARQSLERGVHYLDAPVSGAPIGITAADAGTLTIMVGGRHEAFLEVEPVLASIGGNVRWVGPSGAGSAIKAINQAVYITYMTAFAEGLAIGEALGISTDNLLDTLGTAAAGNPTISTKYEELKGRSNKAFAVDSAVRYFDILEDGSRDLPLLTPVFDATQRSLQDAAKQSLGASDLVIARHRYRRPV